MTLPADPRAFADAWTAAWNAHDVEAVLAHFHDDCLFTSTVAAKLGFGDGGVVRGKAALRDYWTKALALVPGLHFTLLSVHVGVDLMLIGFRNEAGVERAEILRFRDGLVIEGHGTSPVAA